LATAWRGLAGFAAIWLAAAFLAAFVDVMDVVSAIALTPAVDENQARYPQDETCR